MIQPAPPSPAASRVITKDHIPIWGCGHDCRDDKCNGCKVVGYEDPPASPAVAQAVIDDVARTADKLARRMGGRFVPFDAKRDFATHPDFGKTVQLMPADRWWAQRWIDKATPGELAAMRELLAC